MLERRPFRGNVLAVLLGLIVGSAVTRALIIVSGSIIPHSPGKLVGALQAARSFRIGTCDVFPVPGV